MEYGQWMFSSMTGRETAVQVNAEPCPFGGGIDRTSRVPHLLDGGRPDKILLLPSRRPPVFSFLLPLLVAAPLQFGSEETRPDVKPLLHKEIKKKTLEQKYGS